MGTSNQRKRLRKRKNYNPVDMSCEQQGKAIDRINRIGCVQQPRLNKTYKLDGYTFYTGKRHRWGGGTSVTDTRTQPAFLWED